MNQRNRFPHYKHKKERKITKVATQQNKACKRPRSQPLLSANGREAIPNNAKNAKDD